MIDRRGAAWVTAASAALAALAARRWLFGLVSVPTASMAPTVLPGEVLILSRRRAPAVGDVVAVDRSDGALHVKRVVAGEGTEVEIADGRLYLDGVRVTGDTDGRDAWVDADCAARSSPAASESAGGARWRVIPGGAHERERVPAGHLWLLGDHRGASSDSRQWGPAPIERVRGVVVGVAWSRAPCGSLRADRIGFLGQGVP